MLCNRKTLVTVVNLVPKTIYQRIFRKILANIRRTEQILEEMFLVLKCLSIIFPNKKKNMLLLSMS